MALVNQRDGGVDPSFTRESCVSLLARRIGTAIALRRPFWSGELISWVTLLALSAD
jgi:hypothetical protein